MRSDARRRATARLVSVAIGAIGVLWAVANVHRAIAIDRFEGLADHLLRFKTFDDTFSSAVLQSRSAHALSSCDARAQRALIMLEIPLADAALRAGVAGEFDLRNGDLTSRAKKILSCAPSDSFAWLVLFGLAVQSGRLGPDAFALLERSYETSPREAWIAVRRISIAAPVASMAPEATRSKILFEFRQLVRDGYVELPARSYVRSHQGVRDFLDTEVSQLDVHSRLRFKAAVANLTH
ncbi:hypothetical protein DNX69_06430 [Rhodopseudomonas palustris]|uniref:Uncharacterized protein n=1 Tax=Rhodopseudomonas palustris TaxID=1076 RepID=A0A323UP13_RHOPL|nr:hypothetical protein [Rhodopseudomonas palustris]PZA12826.1 hypothetical protein DNX69_06430 [Rhodopseudomonas palustris]